jgi:tRNA pseudouridine55 synthase
MDHSDEILFIDKPSGISSHEVVNVIRRRTGLRRIGHAGTLDPLATGLLIVLVGKNATHRQESFMKLDKEYICEAELGWNTDTYDKNGRVIDQKNWTEVKKVSKKEVEKALSSFRGTFQQTVPPFSAIKQHGRKLYKLALRGKIKTEELPVREVTISDLELLEFLKDETLHKIILKLKIACTSGTYVRSLIHDLGELLQVGATVISLRRTKIGPYKIEDAQPLDQFAGLKAS